MIPLDALIKYLRAKEWKIFDKGRMGSSYDIWVDDSEAILFVPKSEKQADYDRRISTAVAGISYKECRYEDAVVDDILSMRS